MDTSKIVIFEDLLGRKTVSFGNESTLPEEAVAFTYIDQNMNGDNVKPYSVQYRIGSIYGIMKREQVSQIFNPNARYSVHVENHLPYFHLLSGEEKLVNNKEELNQMLNNELELGFKLVKNK